MNAPSNASSAAIVAQATALIQQGRPGEAETLYRRSLASRAAQPNVQINLAQLLAGTGRMAEAIALLRGALRATPNNVDLLMMLAQLQHAAGDIAFAEKHLRAALKLKPGDGLILLSLTGLLNMSERAVEAEALLRDALDGAHPQGLRAALVHNLALALKMQRRNDEALALFDDALATAPGLPAAVAANRAGTLAHLGREDEAIAGYRDALRRDPAHLPAHQELNALLYRLGRDGEFLSSVEEALKLLPEHPGLLATKGTFLNRTACHDAALEAFERASRVQPSDVELIGGMAFALSELGRHEEAVAAYERILARAPDAAQPRVKLASVLLAMGDAKRAMKVSEQALKLAPIDQAALAVHELALRVADNPRAGAMLDYERDVQIFDLDMPDGFNEELNAHLGTLHRDAREHFDQTLRHGTQTLKPLFESDNPLVAQLRGKIEEALAAYIARMDDDPSHPLAARRADTFRFSGSWSSRLRDQGFHTNHIHPMGWISSAYYVAVPDAVADAEAKQGWIKFGEPNFSVAGLTNPMMRAVQPKPGRLVLFPSYTWHGTVPFQSAQARTTIAFDAVPR